MTLFNVVERNAWGKEFVDADDLPPAPPYFGFFRSISGPYPIYACPFGVGRRVGNEFYIRCGSAGRIFKISEYTEEPYTVYCCERNFDDFDSALRFGLAVHYAYANGYLVRFRSGKGL